MVYIIDDDESVLNAMESRMRLAVSGALAFSSAGEFPERVTPSDHDCIILNLCVPGM